MKKLAILLGFALMVGSGAMAEEGAAKAEKPVRAKPVLQQVSVVGKLLQENKTVKNKKTGEEKTVSFYVIEQQDGSKVKLPAMSKKQDGAVDYATMVNQSVIVVGEGSIVQKGEKTITVLRKVTSVQAAGGDEDPIDEGDAG